MVAQCVKIRRNKKVKMPDAIIAATAIIYNLTLITSDNDFNNIDELKIFAPHDL
ncbi:PIN domain-containing protein [Agriterribacter sp.]|uniref:PIN domain-containing protein n=1 Tax=Agriterribacter sp. TaxID=2821509 RepID=UPI002B564F5C|nr:PIN domain-containing protein [Agriterribacter sp.]HTN08300.1 PIN domain-containing protein [Agriterribacter sp.]